MRRLVPLLHLEQSKKWSTPFSTAVFWAGVYRRVENR